MEKIKTSKYRSLHRRYKGPFAICVGVLAERDSDEVRQGESERGPDYPGESSPCTAATGCPITPSCKAIGCGRRSQLPSHKQNHARGPERGR